MICILVMALTFAGVSVSGEQQQQQQQQGTLAHRNGALSVSSSNGGLQGEGGTSINCPTATFSPHHERHLLLTNQLLQLMINDSLKLCVKGDGQQLRTNCKLERSASKEEVESYEAPTNLDPYVGLPLVTLGGRRYFFGTGPLLSWYEATAMCLSLNMRLATVSSADHNLILVNHLRLLGEDTWVDRVWLGGVKISGHFVWTGTLLPFTFSDWFDPRFKPEITSVDFCLEMWRYSQPRPFMWNVGHCFSRSAYICEVPIQ